MDIRNKVLLLVLVLQLVGVGLLYRPGGEHILPPVVNLYADLRVDDVTEFTVTDGTDNKNLRIIRSGKNGWQLGGTDSHAPYPADRNKVATFLAKIIGLHSSRLVARSSSSYDRLQVADGNFNRKVQLTLGTSGQRTLYLGSSPNYKTSHVRDSQHDEVYLVGDLSAWEASVERSSWWEKRYVDIDPQSISKIQIMNLHGAFVLENNAGEWQLSSSSLSSPLYPANEKIDDFIDAVSHVTLQDIVSDKRKIPTSVPVVSVSLATAEGTISIDFWILSDGKDAAIVKSSNSSFYVIDNSSPVKILADFPANLA